MDGLFNKLYWSSTWNETNIGSSFTLPWPQRYPALHILDADIERCPSANTSETQRLPHSLQKQQTGRQAELVPQEWSSGGDGQS